MLAKDIISICKVRVLLVPVSPIKKSTFDRYVQVLQEQCQTVSLADVTPNFKAKFNSQTFQEGQVHFQFQTEWTREEAHLQDFQPYRRLFGVIGIMDCQEWDDLSIGYHQFEKSLSKYPTAIATRCFAFDPIETQEDDIKGLIMIPNVGNISFYMTTMISDFASDILEQLENLAYRLENSTFLESPNNEIPNHRFSYPSASPTTTSSNVKRHSLNLINQSNLPSPLASPTPTMRVRRRTPGRIQKLLGDLYLMAGLLPEAVQCYNTAIEITRSTSDYLWLASALEGWTCVLILLEYLQADMNIILLSENNNIEPIDPYINGESVSPTIEPVVYLGPWSILSIVSERYEKILHYYHDNPLIYSEACLRISRFLVTVYLNRGCHEITFDLLIQGKFKSKKRLSKFFMIDQKKSNFGLTKLTVSEWMMKMWDVQSDLGLLEMIHIRIYMASLYSLLGYHRKCAWLLNEALEYILSLVLKGEKEFDKQNIIFITKRICEVYGIKEPSESGQVLLPFEHKLTDDVIVGWPILQIEALKKCISVAELLNDDRSRFYYTSYLLRRMHPCIVRAEQIRLATIIQGMIINSKYKKENLLHYWGHNILASIRCDAASFIQQQAAVKKDDPFIYSPFSEAYNNQKMEAALSKNQACEFTVILVNPFGFELEIQSIQLCTSGVSIESQDITSIVIPASDFMTLSISGTPQQTGNLIVRGCLIQIAGFEQQEFLLPNQKQEEEHFIKFKKCGLKAIKYEKDVKRNDNNREFLHFSIIDEQPIAEIKSTSHTQNSISLFEGEITSFKIELENTGNTPINFINVHFEDDEQQDAHRPNHLLSLEDQYELEQFNKTPLFSPDSTFKVTKDLNPNKCIDLKPAETTIIGINIFGKGRKSRIQGTIRIGYGHFLPTENQHHILHYLYVDVTLSIYPIIDIFNWDILLFPSFPLYDEYDEQQDEGKKEYIKHHYHQSHDPNPPIEDMISIVNNSQDYCWITMDLRNIWTSPFDIYISAKNDTDLLFRSTISPLSTTRITFPLKRIFLSQIECSRTIPLENNNNNTISPIRLKTFWYRQSLLNNLKVSYRYNARFGTVNIRRFIRSVNSFILDDFELNSTMINARKQASNTFYCNTENEVTLRLEIYNRLARMVKLILRIQLPYQVLFSGNQQMVLPEFSETLNVQDIPLYFLSKGKHTILCHLEDICTRDIYQSKIIVYAD